jgi:hypothetical protein
MPVQRIQAFRRNQREPQAEDAASIWRERADDLRTLGSSKAATLFDIPTSEVYAVRIVPLAKRKLNVDAGVLHAGGYIDNPLLNEVISDNFTGPTAAGKVNLNIRARVAFGVSYGF